MARHNANIKLSRRTDCPLPGSRHRKRRQVELEWVQHHGWASELLNAQRSIMELQRAGGVIGPPMGSTGASLLLWCLGLTDMDPVEWELSPSLFYRASTDPAQRCRWYVGTRRSSKIDRFAAEPLVDGMDRDSAGTIPPRPGTASEHQASRYVATDWTKDINSTHGSRRISWAESSHIPEPEEIWSQRHNRGFDDVVCALSLARPGPASCHQSSSHRTLAECQPK